MLKATRSSEAAARGEKVGQEPLRSTQPLPEKQRRAAVARQERLNTVLAYGCMWCCKTIGRPETNEDLIACPLLTMDDPRYPMSHADLGRAKECKVPDLYADASTGKITKIDPKKVHALVPEFDWQRSRPVFPVAADEDEPAEEKPSEKK